MHLVHLAYPNFATGVRYGQRCSDTPYSSKVYTTIIGGIAAAHKFCGFCAHFGLVTVYEAGSASQIVDKHSFSALINSLGDIHGPRRFPR